MDGPEPRTEESRRPNMEFAEERLRFAAAELTRHPMPTVEFRGLEGGTFAGGDPDRVACQAARRVLKGGSVSRWELGSLVGHLADAVARSSGRLERRDG